ncbi:unnamed protein product [Alopecurus aequalis]
MHRMSHETFPSTRSERPVARIYSQLSPILLTDRKPPGRDGVDPTSTTMATRGTTTSLATSALLLLFIATGPILVVRAGVDVNATCAKTPYPIYCTMVLTEDSDSKTAPNVRALAEIAIRQTARIGAAVGIYARSQLDVVQDNALWQCLDECAQDVEDAVSHLDDVEDKVDDKLFNLVAEFLDLSDDDTWSCDESCRDTPDSPVRTTVLAKNTDFEKMMNITHTLVKISEARPPASAPLPAMSPSATLLPNMP